MSQQPKVSFGPTAKAGWENRSTGRASMLLRPCGIFLHPRRRICMAIPRLESCFRFACSELHAPGRYTTRTSKEGVPRPSCVVIDTRRNAPKCAESMLPRGCNVATCSRSGDPSTISVPHNATCHIATALRIRFVFPGFETSMRRHAFRRVKESK